MTMVLVTIAAACAFLMGYSINQGSTCSVTAAKQLVYQRQITMLAGFAVAIGVAGMVCLPMAWALGDAAHVARDPGISIAVLTGAVLLGVGAVINDACLLGTLARIGDGELRFFALPVGLAAGFAIADRYFANYSVVTTANRFTRFDVTGITIVGLFVLVLVMAWRLLGSRATVVRLRKWPLRRAMVVLGLCGALLFSLTPGWTYADALRRSVAAGGRMQMLGAGVVIAAFAALAGALVSGIRSRAFRYQAPTLATVARSIGGGAIMAVGATFVPGGNDALLLASVPAATIGGVAAFVVMSITVLLIVMTLRALSGPRPSLRPRQAP